MRLFELLTLGSRGSSGSADYDLRVTEHYGVDMIDVDMVMASLENAVGSTGGFCCGRSFVVGHQRLSGLGYCFSASLPPLLSTAASEALNIMDEEPERFVRLRANSKAIHAGLKKAFEGTKFYVQGDDLSPMQLVQYDDLKEVAEAKLDALVDDMFSHDILLTRARYLDRDEAFPVVPSVRVMTSSELTEEELIHALAMLEKTAHSLCA
ncbi:hypothetical protein L596_001707 [Steinernema carpocapsae]|uniref:Serine palmitoyltransferase 1 n=1 Tax=Steinernema carpocapsae TaxID=34508 RepID=A0A4U8UPP8_STECR|nr:hypothetical protein L596_001707 [Steinernema carpocapsae]